MDTAPFRLWLQSKNYSSSTIRNYLMDLNKYLASPLVKGGSRGDFDPKNLSSYLSSISSDPNYHRHLSSLNKYFQFALDQKLIDSNPLKKALLSTAKADSNTHPSLESLLLSYQAYLQAHHSSNSTIRNYINDLKQYINWTETISRET